MKKALLLLTILFLPLSVFANTFVYPGGDTIGINVNFDGVLVVGFYKINGKYNKGKPLIEIGDYIIKINDENVNSINDMTTLIEKANDKRSVKVTIKRDNEEKIINLPLVLDNGKYKTGIYVKDNIKGIGTLTFIDPENLIYGALGHEIIESESGKSISVSYGSIYESIVTDIEKGRSGYAGSKSSRYNYNNIYGDVVDNTKYGIFGNYTNNIDKQLIETSSDIHEGSAFFYTVIEDEKIIKVNINIIDINKNSDTKNILFEITDQDIIEKTGGVVQGMSGSPIIQDGKLVGALTHVIVDNPSKGYGLLIDKMLDYEIKKFQ